MKKIFFAVLFLPLVCFGQPNPILNGSNAVFSITNFRGSGTTDNLGGVPLGTIGSSTTGELGQKVIIIGGGTGGGPSTIADGADVTQGFKADAKNAATDTTPVSSISLLKEISFMLQTPPSQAVTNTGTFSTQVTSVIAGTNPLNLGKAEDAVAADGDTGVLALAVRQASPANTSGTDGDYESLRVDGGKLWTKTSASDETNSVQQIVQKKIAAATYSPTVFTNLGANATLNVKASTGNVFSLSCANANAASRWLQLHNTATTPAGSAVPVYSFLVPAGGQIIIGTDFFTQEGSNFSNGIAFAFSTARDIYTAGTAADQTTVIHYK